jgi:hypothetical protein
MLRSDYDNLRNLVNAVYIQQGIQCDCEVKTEIIDSSLLLSWKVPAKVPAFRYWQVTLFRPSTGARRVEQFPYEPGDHHALRRFLMSVVKIGMAAPMPADADAVSWLFAVGLANKPFEGYATMRAA